MKARALVEKKHNQKAGDLNVVHVAARAAQSLSHAPSFYLVKALMPTAASSPIAESTVIYRAGREPPSATKHTQIIQD